MFGDLEETNAVASFSAYLCDPLRLCGYMFCGSVHRRGAEGRRDTQRKIRNIGVFQVAWRQVLVEQSP